MKSTKKIFESIKHLDENGIEYWYARELMLALEYSKWGNFKNVVKKAKESCKSSDISEEEHFADVGKVLKVGNNADMEIDDIKLTRYACYLIAQNGDSRKNTIALAQTYFAIQTRKQELTEQEYKLLDEDEKRLYTRQNVKDKNKYLFDTAKSAGVKNYGRFNNYGYRGLYNGETAKDIAKRKGISEKEDILDYMSSTELAANLFRITQTDEVIKNNKAGGNIKAIALIVIQDNIREGAHKTLSFFRRNEVKILVISGDNPLTVSAIARKAGVQGAQKYIK